MDKHFIILWLVFMLEEIIGEVLDNKYQIEKELGRGAMGMVCLATHVGTDRLVALKIIFPQSLSSEYVKRFKKEARAAGRLRHPNIINVTDFGISNIKNKEIAYLVMEYLEGITLGRIIIENRSLPLSFVIDIIEQISLGVDKAHEEGVIHRDLKPENIWLEFNGRGGYNVKILDFGIAKLKETENTEIVNNKSELAALSKDEAIKEILDNQEKNLTRTGQFLGTPTYMSPEQSNSKEVSKPSDIYSIGVIAYEMLTGTPPFSADNLITLIYKHNCEPPPSIIEKRGDIPELVEKMIFSALSKKPTERPKSALAFAKALQAAAENETDVLYQAVKFYAKHFYRAVKYAALMYLPVIFGHILLGSVLVIWHQAKESFLIFLFFYFYFVVCFVWAGIIHGKMFTPFVKEALNTTFVKTSNSIVIDGLKLPESLDLKNLSSPESVKQLKLYLENTIKDFFIIIVCFTVLLFMISASILLLRKSYYFYFLIVAAICIYCYYYFPSLLVEKIDDNFFAGPIFFIENKKDNEAKARSKVLLKCFNNFAKRRVFPLLVITAFLAPYFAVIFTWLLYGYTKQYPIAENIVWFVEGFVLIFIFSSSGLLLGPIVPIIKSFDYLKVCKIEDHQL